jgi:hypothetical protein
MGFGETTVGEEARAVPAQPDVSARNAFLMRLVAQKDHANDVLRERIERALAVLDAAPSYGPSWQARSVLRGDAS